MYPSIAGAVSGNNSSTADQKRQANTTGTWEREVTGGPRERGARNRPMGPPTPERYAKVINTAAHGWADQVTVQPSSKPSQTSYRQANRVAK